ncbi:MAG: hypothetical protein Q7V12_08155, partial [Deltaproteobacteria bacterium]|nr:hypothetical protein [Deltaproteobacteria bacterium]
LRLMKRIFSPVPKKRYRNRAGVLGGFAGKSPHNAAGIFPKPCSGTFGSWLHAFLGKTGNAPKVKSSSNPNFSNNPQLQGFGSTPDRV